MTPSEQRRDVNSERWWGCQAPQDRRETFQAAKDIRLENGWRCKRRLCIYIFISSKINIATWVTLSFKKEIQMMMNREKAHKKTNQIHTQIPYRYQTFYLFFKETTALYMITELWSTVKQKRNEVAWIQALTTSHLFFHTTITQKNNIIWKEIKKI